MNYRELARRIRAGYACLERNIIYKEYNVAWNDELKTSEITVENDAEFKAIIIGNARGMSKSRGYMYLFYTNDRSVPFPTVREIERRLKIVANKEVLDDEDAKYFDWEEYGSLQEQREYFSEILLERLKTCSKMRIMGESHG